MMTNIATGVISSRMKTKILISVLSLCSCFLAACATAPKNTVGPEIISLKKDFETFSNEHHKSADSIFFKIHQNLFENLVYPEIRNEPEETIKRKLRLVDFLKANNENRQKIIDAFSNLERTSTAAISEFKKKFPNGDYRYKIYFVPSLLWFSGRAEVFEDNSVGVAFGADNIAKNGETVPILFAHEMFHALHFKTLNLSKTDYDLFQVDPIALLWLEGFASYETALVNTILSTPSIVFGKLGEECESQNQRLHRLFLDDVIAHSKFSPEFTDKWFGSGDSNQKIPPMAGYCIGLNTVKKMAGEYSEKELLSWNPILKRDEIIRAIEAMRDQ